MLCGHGDGRNLRPQFEPRALFTSPISEMIGKTDPVEPEFLDLPATAQEFGPRHVRAHDHGKTELVRQGYILLRSLRQRNTVKNRGGLYPRVKSAPAT
jgi:hypothetical protein